MICSLLFGSGSRSKPHMVRTWFVLGTRYHSEHLKQLQVPSTFLKSKSKSVLSSDTTIHICTYVDVFSLEIIISVCPTGLSRYIRTYIHVSIPLLMVVWYYYKQKLHSKVMHTCSILTEQTPSNRSSLRSRPQEIRPYPPWSASDSWGMGNLERPNASWRLVAEAQPPNPPGNEGIDPPTSTGFLWR